MIFTHGTICSPKKIIMAKTTSEKSCYSHYQLRSFAPRGVHPQPNFDTWLVGDYFAAEDYFRQNTKRDEKTGCLRWKKRLNNAGYGCAQFLGCRTGAHRFSWMFHHKKNIPNDLEILHDPLLCKHRDCIEPNHLRVGTTVENALDRKIAGTTLCGSRNPNTKYTQEQKDHLRNLLLTRKKYTSQGLARETNTSKILVDHTKKLLGLTKQRTRKGFSFEEVSEILEKRKLGKTCEVLANEYKCSLSSIYNIVRGNRQLKTAEKPKSTDKQEIERMQNRLQSKIIKDENHCWLYRGYKNPDGYGTLQYQSKSFLAHVISYRFFKNNGELVPKGLLISHNCPSKPSKRHCINPEHLDIGTVKKNNGDDQKRDGTNKRKRKWTEEFEKEIFEQFKLKPFRDIQKEYKDKLTKNQLRALRNKATKLKVFDV